jgi:hypothetical protein
MEFTSEDISILGFQPALVRCGDNHASALAVEMQRDLYYTGEYNQGTPYFTFVATRFEEQPIELTVTPGVWVILLWGELHVFRDDVFRNTFVIEMADPGTEKTDADEDVLQEALWKVVPPEATVEGTGEVHEDSTGLHGKLDVEEVQASERLYKDAMQAAKGPDGTEIMQPVEPFEHFVEKATGKSLQFRKGVYEQLSDEAKQAFERPGIPQGNLDKPQD